MNNFAEFIERTLQIRKEERQKVWLITKHHFLQGLGIAFLHITAVKLFFKDFDPLSPHYTDLALIIIVAAVIQLIAGRIYAFFEHNAEFNKLQKGVVASLIFISLFFTISLWIYPKGKYLIFGLLISYYLFYQISNLELWGVASLLFDVRQGKRLFTLISIGNIPAKMIGYFSYLLLYKTLGEISFIDKNKYQLMLAIGFLSFVGSYYILKLIIKKLPLQKIEHHLHHHGPAESITIRIFKSPFILAMAVLSLCAHLTFYPLEYKFLLDANNIKDIAAFIAVYYGVLHLISGLFQIFYSNRIIQKYGVLSSLTILPVLILVFSVLWLVIPDSVNIMDVTLTMSMLIMLIWVVLYYSLYNPLYLGLFQPLDAPSRLHGHTIVKGLINPLAMLIAGIFLLALNKYMASYIENFIIFFIISASVLFIVSILSVNRQYSLSLQQGIQSKWFRGDRYVVVDQKHIHIIEKRMKSDFPADIIYSLDVLQKLDEERYKQLLMENINSIHPDVQMYCLQKMSAFPDLFNPDRIVNIARNSTFNQIKTTAIELYCKVADFEYDSMSKFLESDNTVIRKAAITGLIKRGDIESVVLAGQQLLSMLSSEQSDQKTQGLEIIGDLGIKSYYRPVLEALKSPDPVIRNKAIEISAEIPNPKLLPELIKIFEDNPVSPLIRSALIRSGDDALKEFKNIVSNHPPVRTMRSIIRICEKVNSPLSKEVLIKILAFPNTSIQNEAASALSSLSYKTKKDDLAYWSEKIHELLDQIYDYLSFARILGKTDYKDLEAAINNEAHSLKLRLFDFLGYSYEETITKRSKGILLFQNPGSKANAIETLEQELPGRLFKRILPLFESFEESSVEDDRSPHELITLIIAEGLGKFNRWTVANAIKNCPEVNISTVVPYLFQSSVILKDTASKRIRTIMKGLSNLDRKYFEEISDELFNKIRQKLTEDQPRLLTIEKVIALKGTSLFANIPENILIDIAEVIMVEDIKKGNILFEAGDTADYMYIIYEGVVKIHLGTTVFAYLKSRDFFGELALLDTEPRSATATAEEDCLLLRLNQDIFYELLIENKEFAKGFLKTLSQRLRNQNQKLQEIDGGE